MCHVVVPCSLTKWHQLFIALHIVHIVRTLIKLIHSWFFFIFIFGGVEDSTPRKFGTYKLSYRKIIVKIQLFCLTNQFHCTYEQFIYRISGTDPNVCWEDFRFGKKHIYSWIMLAYQMRNALHRCFVYFYLRIFTISHEETELVRVLVFAEKLIGAYVANLTFVCTLPYTSYIPQVYKYV